MYRKAGRVILIGICCIVLFSVTGCGAKDRTESFEDSIKTDKEYSDAMMQSIIDAFEMQDVNAMKDLFSTYAQEHEEGLDEKIEEIMEFYPGCSGGFEGECETRERSDNDNTVWELTGIYTVYNNDSSYRVRFTAQSRNDREPDKIGLSQIEIK